MRTVTAEVSTDYSQIELDLGDGGRADGPVDLGLVTEQREPGPMILIIARQWGEVTIDVQVHETEPPVDPAWGAAAEWSARTGDRVTVSGWAGESPAVVPVAPDLDVRMRYVVLDGQRGHEQSRAVDHDPDEAPAERYLLQVWPAPRAHARLVAATEPWSQYWAFGPAAAALTGELADVPDPGRFDVVVDRALAAHPDVRARLVDGDRRYVSGILRYTQELFRATYQAADYVDLRQDHVQIEARIVERALAAETSGTDD
ncbi:MAG TPA: hypothetical protein VGC57_04260 [Cellulomonas sp.]